MPQQLVTISPDPSGIYVSMLAFRWPVRLIACGFRCVATATQDFACGVFARIRVDGELLPVFSVGVTQSNGEDVTYCFSRGLGTLIKVTAGDEIFVSGPLPDIVINPDTTLSLGFLGGQAEPVLAIDRAYAVVSFSGKERTKSQKPNAPAESERSDELSDSVSVPAL